MKHLSLVTKTIAKISLCSIVAFSAQLRAQEPTEIVITAKGKQTLASIVATANIITRPEIESSQAQSVPEILNSISGISVRNSGSRGSTTGVFVRGTTGSQIVVLIDGIRSGSPTVGSTNFSHLPIEAIERIEIIKGPLSGIYGADAMGGVIQIFTKKGIDLQNGNISLSAGSNAFKKGVVSFRTGNEKNNFLATLATEKTDGIDSTSILSGGNDDDDSFETNNFNLSGNFSLSKNTQLRMSHLQTENEIEFDNTFGDDIGYVSENAMKNTAITLNSALSNSLQWNTILGKQTDEIMTKVFASDIEGDRLSFTTQIEKQLPKNKILTLGIDAYDESVNSTTSFPVSDRDNKGIFTQLKKGLGGVDIVANVRFDDNSAYGDNTNGSLAINRQLNPQTRLTVSYGTAFRAPTFNDLYFPGFGNPDIQPEESKSLEISLRGDTASSQWRVSAFNTDIKNLIGFDSATFLAANIADASIQGLEFELSTNINDWYLAANLDLLSTEDAATGEKLDDRVEKTLNLSASKNFGAFSTRIDALAEDGRHDLSGTELPNFVKFDLSGSYAISKNFKVSAKVNNLLDKDYTVNLISPTSRYNTEGRTFKITGKYAF